MENKVLTISIAAYNAEAYLKRCLEALVSTAVIELLDVIVVNDGSDDETEIIATEYVNRFPNSVRLINKSNGGHGSTINIGILEANGKYFKIVDADDWVDKKGIEKLVNFLEKNEVDLILNSYYEVSADTCEISKMVKPFDDKQLLCEIQDFNYANNIYMYMHSITINSIILKKMGPIIDEHCFYVDMEYTVFPIVYINNYICFDYPVYKYLLGTETQSMNINNLISRKDQHLRVTKRLTVYFNEKSEKLIGNKREVASNRIKMAIYNQYKIYCHMNPVFAVEEIKNFDNWLKKESLELYQGPEGKFMKLIKFYRKIGYRFFIPITRLLQKVKLIPNI